ncbi:methionine ABC transporter ATP-binding protein [Thiobaca trueperi]|uniref:Cell division ATP-binding protein FtsE n=1 Tax=Thiobaca trueperi TaxID=127458 RepID=A0A4R3MTQ3_9GAMM|nr:ATP-binding cassette domain-containing protein [Thiobaca trueperi]TCT19425.1 D-methionine transport system ATP-binding protein [Thiobaca trueperi]
MIELQNISIEFRTKDQVIRAVDQASLHIGTGEVFGIVGASGAGKSSLLRTINLLERPSAGRVRLDGRDITDLKGAALRRERQKTGLIFQHFNLMHTRTVFDNVAFALRVAGKQAAEIAAHVPEILDLVGLSDKVQVYPSQLSGGQKQRVGIARAIANHPAVLLCDEPTSALDLETSGAILELLKEINRRLGITIVLISHEMSVIKTICDRVAVMDQGRIVEQGDVYDIFARPEHPFTRQLVDRTFNLDLPERLTANLQGTLLKILFLGERAEHPLLSEAALRFGISVNILHGKIEYINNRAIGLLVALLGELQECSTHAAHITEPLTGRIAAAVDFIRQGSARVEVLHA